MGLRAKGRAREDGREWTLTGPRSDSVSDEERADLDAILIGGLAPRPAPSTGSFRGEPDRDALEAKREEVVAS